MDGEWVVASSGSLMASRVRKSRVGGVAAATRSRGLEVHVIDGRTHRLTLPTPRGSPVPAGADV